MNNDCIHKINKYTFLKCFSSYIFAWGMEDYCLICGKKVRLARKYRIIAIFFPMSWIVLWSFGARKIYALVQNDRILLFYALGFVIIVVASVIINLSVFNHGKYCEVEENEVN